MERSVGISQIVQLIWSYGLQSILSKQLLKPRLAKVLYSIGFRNATELEATG